MRAPGWGVSFRNILFILASVLDEWPVKPWSIDSCPGWRSFSFRIYPKQVELHGAEADRFIYIEANSSVVKSLTLPGLPGYVVLPWLCFIHQVVGINNCFLPAFRFCRMAIPTMPLGGGKCFSALGQVFGDRFQHFHVIILFITDHINALVNFIFFVFLLGKSNVLDVKPGDYRLYVEQFSVRTIIGKIDPHCYPDLHKCAFGKDLLHNLFPQQVGIAFVVW